MAALKFEVNATKTALATEVALKLGGGATVDATLPRFTGDVTCYVDDATGDVVGLKLGSSAPLCSTAGTARSFNVPHEGHDGHIADVKVAVDKATGLVGGLTFVVKTNDSALIPTNVVTCGTRGGVGVSIMPKLAALAGVTASCKTAQSGRRLHQAGGSGLALDPVSLGVTATTVNAPAGGSAPPPPPPAVPPTVLASSATIRSTQTTLVIAGSNFDPSAGGNVVTLSSGTVGSIWAASTTSLTIVFGTLPSPGPLSASVTAFGLSSGAAVQVAIVATPTALVTNNGQNTVTQCAISGGSITSCAVPPGVTWNLNGPRGIAVANNVAYITNLFGNTVTQCAISGGSITSCAVPPGVTWNLNGPFGIAVANNVAYITNRDGNTVTQCMINTIGNITSCAVPPSVTWNLNGPTPIAVI